MHFPTYSLVSIFFLLSRFVLFFRSFRKWSKFNSMMLGISFPFGRVLRYVLFERLMVGSVLRKEGNRDTLVRTKKLLKSQVYNSTCTVFQQSTLAETGNEGISEVVQSSHRYGSLTVMNQHGIENRFSIQDVVASVTLELSFVSSLHDSFLQSCRAAYDKQQTRTGMRDAMSTRHTTNGSCVAKQEKDQNRKNVRRYKIQLGSY